VVGKPKSAELAIGGVAEVGLGTEAPPGTLPKWHRM